MIHEIRYRIVWVLWKVIHCCLQEQKRESEECKANRAQRSRDYYKKKQEKHNETIKKYHESNKEKLINIKEKREENKIKYVVSKLKSIDMEVLAKK